MTGSTDSSSVPALVVGLVLCLGVMAWQAAMIANYRGYRTSFLRRLATHTKESPDTYKGMLIAIGALLLAASTVGAMFIVAQMVQVVAAS